MNSPDTAFPRTLALLEEGRTTGLHLGAQLFVALRGRTLASLAVGERRPGEPMTTDTLLLWLSSGKPLTAIAIAQQWERGRLDLDDLVATHLPEFATGGKEGIRIRHLLTHTGGFRSADENPEQLPWDQAIQSVCSAPLEPGWIPGVTAGYHTRSSWFILAEIVRRLTGGAFSHYLREEILLPLGMSNCWVGMPPTEFKRYGPRIGTTFLTFPGPPIPSPTWDDEVDCALCRPASNARGPVEELGRLYQALLDGGHGILRPETIREFTRRHRTGVHDATFRHVIDMGLGFLINSNRYGMETVPYGYGRHASTNTFGHSGSQSSCAFADPEHGLVVAWACNGLPGEPRHQRRQRALNTAIYEDLQLNNAAPATSGSQAPRIGESR